MPAGAAVTLPELGELEDNVPGLSSGWGHLSVNSPQGFRSDNLLKGILMETFDSMQTFQVVIGKALGGGRRR